jgi:hypothetical protein
MPYRCYHFWHNREQADMTGYQKSFQLLQQLSSLDKDKLQMHVNATVGKIGMLNQYS